MLRLFRLTNKNHKFNFNHLIRNNPSRSFSNSYIRYSVNSDRLVDEGNQLYSYIVNYKYSYIFADILKSFEQVSVIDLETNKPLPLQSTKSVLDSIQRSKYRLELVSISDQSRPLVKLIDKSEEYKKQKEKSKKQKELKSSAKSKQNVVKEIQLTWLISSNDLNHKLKKAFQVLNDGGKVSVVFANSSAHKRVSDDVKNDLIYNVELQLGLYDNTKSVVRWKESEKSNRFWAIHLKSNN